MAAPSPVALGRVGLAALAAVLALVALSLAVALGVSAAPGEVAAGRGAAAGGEGVGGGSEGDAWRLAGRVWLEDPQGPEAGPLTPAVACRVRARREGRVLAEGRCDGAGRYALELASDLPPGEVAVEIEVPGRLRAVLTASVPPESALPEVALGLGQVVRGRVLASDGRPLSGVEVRARPEPDLGEPEPWRARTDDTGAFAFDTLPPGPVTLWAAAPGHAPTTLPVVAPVEGVDLVLDRLVRVAGRVEDAAGRPAAGVQVRLEGSSVWPPREVTTGAGGRFVFVDLPAGVFEVEAADARDEAHPRASASVGVLDPRDDLALRLAPAGSLPVKVVDPSGAAVAGATISARRAGVGLLQRRAAADAEGRARLAPLAPGRLRVQASAEGYLPSQDLLVDVAAGENAPVTLRLGRPGRLEGVVVDEHGEPVVGAEVHLDAEGVTTPGELDARAQVAAVALREAGQLGVTTGPVPAVPTRGAGSITGPVARTGPGGRFAAGGLFAGRYRLWADARDFAASATLPLRLRSGEVRRDVRLVLRPGVPLVGRVRDGNLRPVAGAWITLDDGTATATDASGVFDAGHVPAAGELVVRAPGMAPRRVSWRSRGEPLELAVTLEPADARVEGRVLDGNGQPWAGAGVECRPLDGLSPTAVTFTDDRGLFVCDGLPVGAVAVGVEAEGAVSTLREVAASRHPEPFDLSLATARSLVVEVVAAGSREPVAGAEVRLGGRAARTGPDGRATAEGLAPGSYPVEVHAEGFVPARATAKVAADGSSEPLWVELAAGGGIEGVVTDYRGDPVAGVMVSVEGADGGELARVRADARGAFAVVGLPEGDVTLRVEPPPGRAEELGPGELATDVLRDRVTRGVDLRLPRR